MNTPHKHAKWIHLFADGVPLQYRTRTPPETWRDVREDHIWSWLDVVEYRLKPAPLRYRVAKVRQVGGVFASAASSPEDAAGLEGRNSFVEWLTGWVEYTDE